MDTSAAIFTAPFAAVGLGILAWFLVEVLAPSRTADTYDDPDNWGM